jgi:hypothetical protein
VLGKFASNPKSIFLIDGIGAFLTAIFLSAVLVTFQDHFGMPADVLYVLSTVAAFYGICSISFYLVQPRDAKALLKLIAVANFLYCVATIGVIGYFYTHLTTLAFIYFSIEITIIFFLAMVELDLSRKLGKEKTNF